MKEKFIRLKLLFEFLRCSPHLLLYFTHKNKSFIKADVNRWREVLQITYNDIHSLLFLLSFFPEFRNLFYVRVGVWKHFLNVICPQLSSLYIATTDIGKGLFIQHGFSTIIAAKSIGENCWINQQVTIGFANNNDSPFLRDNVTVYAGAKVIGNITIGSNSIIGANAAVVKNVPNNCTVVGVPAVIIKRDGARVNEKL